jgi:hypothetical protein
LWAAPKGKRSPGATFAKWSPAAVRLAEWAEVRLAGGCLFKSDADLTVFAAVKGHVIAMRQIV